MVTTLHYDEATGVGVELTDDGLLIFKDGTGSWYNLVDTPANRKYMERDFRRHSAT